MRLVHGGFSFVALVGDRGGGYFTGIENNPCQPIWQTKDKTMTSPRRNDVEYHLRRARELRAEATRDMLRSLFGGRKAR